MSQTPAPPQAVLQLMMGAWVSQAAGTIARLRVCDHVAAGATTPDAVAAKANANADAMHRLMRAAAMVGILRRDGDRYGLTQVGELFRSDNPRSMRALVDAETAPGHWLPWGRLDDCVRTGTSAAEAALGCETFAYYERNPEEGRTFSQGMSGLSAAAIGAVAEAWHPPAATTVVDVGGAHGAFLGFVLDKLPAARGILLDMPSVIAEAPKLPRTELVGGDFFATVPTGDLYLMKHILHDWDDARCLTILRNIRSAMAKNATVAIVEMLVPEDGSPSPAILLDLNMLVMLPGRERTAREMTDLLASADLAVQRVVATHSPFSLIEARAR
jgi:hypothetical protein